MERNMKKHKRIGGFSLVEMMVAVVIASLFIGWSYAAYVVHQKTFTTESQVTEMQYSGGTVLDMIEKDLRESGFGVPDNPNIFGHTSSVVMNDSGANGGPDTLDLLGGYTRIGTLANSVNPGITSLNITWEPGFDPSTAYVSYLSIDGLTYLETTSFPVSSGNTVSVTRPVNRYYPSGRVVYALEFVSYSLSTSDNILYRTTPLGSDPVAFNIDDLQFQGLDINGNPPATPGETARIRVSLLARTEREVQNKLEPLNSSITLENNTTATSDYFRRRVYRIEVSLRNPLR